MATAVSRAPNRLLLSVSVALVALAVGPAWFYRSQVDGPLPLWLVSGLAGGALFGAAGLTAWRIRPESRIGPWMIAFAVVQLARQVDVTPGAPGEEIIALVQPPLVFLAYPIATLLLLGYPTGRLPPRSWERLVVGFQFAVVAADIAVVALTMTPVPPICWECARSPFAVVDSAPLYLSLTAAVRCCFVVAGVLVLLLLRRQARTWTPLQRRSRTLMLVAGSIGTACAGAAQVLTSASYARWLSPDVAVPVTHVALWAIGIGLPASILLALVRERLAFSSVGDLLVALDRAPPDRIGEVLAEALRDPSLQVAFPTQLGLVDAAGRPVTPGPDRAVTPLGRPAVAVVVHDPGVAEHGALLRAASSAARLTLENARLQAEVQANLTEVRASRLRIVAAADEARRRVERDLHDGAQQRLLGVGLALHVLEQNLDEKEQAATLIDDARQELLTALRELRELAAGIYPAVLTDQGLLPALLGLAARSSVPVTVRGDDPGRLPAPVETTAYFCASEAWTNAVKHARATTVRIELRVEPPTLVLTIADDGIGGARADGQGLGGLADRLAAVNGRLAVDSPIGGGTTITAELPCA